MIVDRQFPKRLISLLFKPKRFKVLVGGRNSTKSQSVARMLVLRAHTEPLRILCTRELQNSIKDSVHKLLCNIIEEYDLSDFFEITRDSIRGSNGSEFIFKGLKNNPASIKSTEAIDVVFCEEAESITEQSWEFLIPTIRKQGSEIIIVFNPLNELDDTYVRFVKPYLTELGQNGHYEDETVYVVKINYTDNPWITPEQLTEIDRLKISDFQKYLHIYEGTPVGASERAIISPLWVRASIDAHIKLGWQGRGIKALGFDPADEGQDNKGIIVRHGSLVTVAKSWTTGNIIDATQQAFDTAKETGSTDFIYDAVGVGAAVKQALTTLEGRDRLTVVGFRGNDIPENPKDLYRNDRANHDVFRNRRAQAFWLLRDRFEATYNAVENGVYTNPEELISLSSNLENLTELTSELSRVERKYGVKDLIQLESKQDMRKRGFKSPGLADALSYAFSSKPLDPSGWGEEINYNNQGYL